MRTEMKYTNRTTSFFLSIGWGIITAITLIEIIIVILTPMDMGFYVILPLIMLICSFLLCKYCITIYLGLRNYIVIEDECIFIDCGPIRPKRRIELKSIKNSIVLGNLMKLSCENGRDFSINLNFIRVDDINELISKFKIS